MSVVMPVHNALPHLDSAIRSILGQTFENFEFVIFDDGSTDGSTERLDYWAAADPRIRLFHSSPNLGPAASSNAVVQKSRAPIIARMDADDVSAADRLSVELELLEQHPEVGLVGTLCEIIDQTGKKVRGSEAWRLSRNAWFAPFPHGSIMYRREVFERIGGYRTSCEFWEDQDLVLRMARETQIMVVPRALYQHRQSPTSTRVASEQARVERAVDLMYRCGRRIQRGEPYEDLLENNRKCEKVDPRVFISLGSLVLWTNDRPRLFRRLLRGGDLSFSLASISAIAWTGWASLSPGSLRGFLRLLLAGRNLYASAKVRTDQPVRWSPATNILPGHAAEDSRSA